MRNTFNFLLALLNFMDSCFLLGMILEVLRNNFRLGTNFHLMIYPYFLYPFNSIALTFSIFMTISIAFERYDAMHNIAQHNQVRAKSLHIMVLLVMEFQDQGYKIRKIKINTPIGNYRILRIGLTGSLSSL